MIHFGGKTAVGISITDRVLEVVALDGGEKPSMRSRNRIVLEPGVIDRDAVQNEAKLAAAIEDLFRKAQPTPISLGSAIVGFPEGSTYIHIFETAAVTEKEIVRQVAENIPLPANDVAWSFRSFPAGAGTFRVVVAAASRSQLERWQKFFSSCGISVSVFDIELFAVLRNLFREFPSEPVLVADIGAHRTSFSILDASGLAYTRSVRVAGAYLTQEIARSLGISQEEAEQQKQSVGLGTREHPAFFALVKGLEILTREMHAAIDYFMRTHQKRISQIVLVGGSSRLAGFAEYIEANFNVPVVVAPPTSDIEAVGYALRALETRWEKTDPLLMPSYGKNNAVPSESHWSLPQKFEGSHMMRWLAALALFISIVFLGTLVYFRYVARE